MRVVAHAAAGLYQVDGGSLTHAAQSPMSCPSAAASAHRRRREAAEPELAGAGGPRRGTAAHSVLATHNHARDRVGVAPLAWSDEAGRRRAGPCAIHGRNGRLRPRPDARTAQEAGENLWMGTRGVFAYEVMVGVLVDEAQRLPPGRLSRRQPHRQLAAMSAITPRSSGRRRREVGCALASERDQRLSRLPLFAGRQQDGSTRQPLARAPRPAWRTHRRGG